MTWWQVLLLIGGGTVAGVINCLAGGGSMLTVPLLVVAGVPGTIANGSNRVGILTSNAASVSEFRRLGVGGFQHALPVLAPAAVGAAVGLFGISQLTNDEFERLFGLLMIPLIMLAIRRPPVRTDGHAWSRLTVTLVFFGVGIYGGAIQAGVGLVMLAALSRAGFDLVTANSVKVMVTLVVTCIALPIFVLQGKVDWIPAIVLAIGLTIGGWLGPRLSIKGGEKAIRSLMVVCAIALAIRLLFFG